MRSALRAAGGRRRSSCRAGLHPDTPQGIVHDLPLPLAILSALFSLGRLLIWRVSGEWAESLGYTSYFFLTFLLALPAYALLPWVRRTLEARHAGTVREGRSMLGVYAVVAVIVGGLGFIVVDVVRDLVG